MTFGIYRLRTAMLGRSGMVARRLRTPLPHAEPWRRACLDVVRDGGIGDVLLCTPALREVKRRNPGIAIRLYTSFPDPVRGLPYLDAVLPRNPAPRGAILLGYEDTRPRVHLARIIGDMLGVAVRDVRPDCMVDPARVARYRAAWGAGPNVVVLRRAGGWTPNKDWPMPYWNALLPRLARDCRVIEVGVGRAADAQVPDTNHVDLRGATDLPALAAAVAAADLYVGPVSGPMHIAAAVGRPAVVICGGYELARNTAYATCRMLSNMPACAPCWLREPCPHGRICLSAISVDAVLSNVAALLRATQPAAPSPR